MDCKDDKCDKGFRKPSPAIEKMVKGIIKDELQKLTIDNSPKIYKEIQTIQGYADVENSILEQMFETLNTPDVIIERLEKECLVLNA